MNKLAVLAVVPAAALALSVTASSASITNPSNRMTFQEWYDTPSGETQHNVEAPESSPTATGEVGCGCTGTVVSRYTDGKGRHHKWVAYPDTKHNSSILSYVKEGKWWITRGSKIWATDGVGEVFGYGN